MPRKPYPRDVSDEEWVFVAPSLIVLTANDSQRDHSLREVLNGWRWIVRTGGETLHCNVSPTRMTPNDLPPWDTVSTRRRCNAPSLLKAEVGATLFT